MRDFYDFRHGHAEQMRDMGREQEGCVGYGIEMRRSSHVPLHRLPKQIDAGEPPSLLRFALDRCV